MNETTAKALSRVLDDLEAFEIELNAYYDDLEPQSIIDTVLNGKINSLRAFCQSLGWHDLSLPLKDMVPLRGTAVESLEVIQSFVVPEARRLLSSTEVGGKAGLRLSGSGNSSTHGLLG